jgi:hypothetical protein
VDDFMSTGVCRDLRKPFFSKTGGAWDYPLCKDDKTWRLIQLFKAEVEHSQGEIRALQNARFLHNDSFDHNSEGSCRKCASKSDGDQDIRGHVEQVQKSEVLEDGNCLQHDTKQMEEKHRAEVERLAAELDRREASMNEYMTAHRQREAELEMSLALLREFGQDSFMRPSPDPPSSSQENVSADNDVNAKLAEAVMPSVLIAVDLDLGMSTARLCVTPWQTGSDFEKIVKEFLEEHGVRPIFSAALVQYLLEVEENATSLPVFVSASLADLYSNYG